MKKIILVIVLLAINAIPTIAASTCLPLTQADFTGSTPHNVDYWGTPKLVGVNDEWGAEWWIQLTDYTCYEITENIQTQYPIRVINYLPPDYFPTQLDPNMRPYNPLEFSCGTYDNKKSITYTGSYEMLPDDAGYNVGEFAKIPVLIIDGYVEAKNCVINNGELGLWLRGNSYSSRFQINNPRNIGVLMEGNSILSEATIKGPYYGINPAPGIERVGLMQYDNSKSYEIDVDGIRRTNIYDEPDLRNKDSYLDNGIVLKDYSQVIGADVNFAYNHGVSLYDNARARSVTVRDAYYGFYLRHKSSLIASESYEHRKVGILATGNSTVSNSISRDSFCSTREFGNPTICNYENEGDPANGVFATTGLHLSGSAKAINVRTSKNGYGVVVSSKSGTYGSLIKPELKDVRAEDNRDFGFYIQEGPVKVSGLVALRNGMSVYSSRMNSNWFNGIRFGDYLHYAGGIEGAGIFSFDNMVAGIRSYSDTGNLRNVYSCNNQGEYITSSRPEIIVRSAEFIFEGLLKTTLGGIDIDAPVGSTQLAQISGDCPELPPTGGPNTGTNKLQVSELGDEDGGLLR